MPKGKSSTRQNLRLEGELRLQQEINAYIQWMSMEDSLPHSPFEKRLIEAFEDRERTVRLVEDMARLCSVGTQTWRTRASEEAQVLWLALHTRGWLERWVDEPVTRAAIREIVEVLWAAHLRGFKPTGTIYSGHDGPIPFILERPPGAWSEADYISCLLATIAKDNDLATNLKDVAARGFPKGVWKRVWKDPRLRDLKSARGRPSVLGFGRWVKLNRTK